jgi:hypothetical protein
LILRQHYAKIVLNLLSE